MRLKTAYRKSHKIPAEEIPEPNIPEIKIDGQKPEAEVGISGETEAEPEDVAAAAIGAATEADQAKYALVKQIEALRQSEELQRRQQMAMAAQRPMSRDDRLEMWKAQGLSDKEANFLRDNPEMIDFPQVASHAAAEAMQAGHERDSEGYFKATEANFDRHMKQLKAQAAAQPTPQFFQPPPPPQPRTEASFVSAPVSRTAPAGGYREPSPSSVRLSPDELQIAANSGISPTEYARHKLRMEREKRMGIRQ